MPITLCNDQITRHTEAHMHYDGGPILAIDAATRCGFAFGEPGKTPLLESIALRRPTDPRTVAFGNASRIIYKFINSPTPPVLVVIEGTVPLIKIKGKRKTDAGASVLKGLYAIFAGAAEAHGIPVQSANIQKWRKHSLGAGNLTTEEAKRRSMQMCERFGWQAADDNAADAAGIWLWACSQVGEQHRPLSTFSKMDIAEYRAIALVRGRAG